MKMLAAVLLAINVFLAAWVPAASHGFMNAPVRPRNVINSNWCPQCANGPGPCGEGGGQWITNNEPARLNGPFANPPTTLQLGSTIEVGITITAAHLGHFILDLCRPTGDTITEDCFTVRLQRDPTDTRWSPFLASDPASTFFPNDPCVVSQNILVRYRIPEAFGACEHCILRWFWQTGNSCASHPAVHSHTAPTEIRNWTLPNGCAIRLSAATLCGDNCPTAQCRFEQFKNCADVRLVGGGGGGGTQPPPTTAAPTTQAPILTQPPTQPQPGVTQPPVTTTQPAGGGGGADCLPSTLRCNCALWHGNTFNCGCAP